MQNNISKVIYHNTIPITGLFRICVNDLQVKEMFLVAFNNGKLGAFINNSNSNSKSESTQPYQTRYEINLNLQNNDYFVSCTQCNSLIILGTSSGLIYIQSIPSLLTNNIINTQQPLILSGQSNLISYLTVIPLNNLISCSYDGTIFIRAIKDDNITLTKQLQSSTNKTIKGAVYLQHHKTLLTVGEKIFMFWDINTFEQITALQGMLPLIHINSIIEYDDTYIIWGTNESIVLFDMNIWWANKVIKLGDNVHPYSLLKMTNGSVLIGCNGNRLLYLNPNDNNKMKFIPQQGNEAIEGTSSTFVVGMFEDVSNEKVVTASQDGVVIELDIMYINNEKLSMDLNDIHI